MKTDKLAKLLMIASIICSFVILSSAQAVGAAKIYIDPAKINAEKAGQSLTLEVKVSDVNDLYGYQFDIVFPASLLEVTKIESKHFLGAEADTFFLAGKIDNNKGRVTGIAESRKGAETGKNGSGTLLAFTIDIKQTSPGDITLEDVKLVKSNVTTIVPLTVTGASFEKQEAPKMETVKQGESGLQPSNQTQSAENNSAQNQSSPTNPGKTTAGTALGQAQSQTPAQTQGQTSTNVNGSTASGASNEIAGSTQSPPTNAGNTTIGANAQEKKGSEMSKKAVKGADRQETVTDKPGFFANIWISFVTWIKGLFD